MSVGFPVALSMGLTSVVTLGALRGFTEIPWDILAQRIMYGVTNFTLLAIPFFILAGRLCNEAQITDRIFEFAKTLVGHFKGGLGHVNIAGQHDLRGDVGLGRGGRRRAWARWRSRRWWTRATAWTSAPP